MLRNFIVDFSRGAGVLFGMGITLSAWAGDTSVTIGNGSTTVTGARTVLNFPLTRTGDLTYDAYLAYQTQDSSAVAGTDYMAARGFLLLPAGTASLNLPVQVNGRNSVAADKSLTLNLLGITTLAPNLALSAQQAFAAGTGPDSIAAADMNGDGKPDLIVANYSSNTVSVLVNTTAAGASTPSFATQQTFNITDTAYAVTVADMTGDGKPDLIVSDGSGASIYRMVNATTAGSSIVSFPTIQGLVTGLGAYSLAAADLNGDGKPDLVAGGNPGGVMVYLNNTATDATAITVKSQVVVVGTNTMPIYVAVADLNGDGKPDIVAVDHTTSTASSAYVLLNTTATGAQTATFASPQALAVGHAPEQCAIGDVNGDGKPDLVVVNNTDNTVSVLINSTANGAGTPSFAAQQTFALAGHPNSVAVTDVDGDGRLDLVVGYDTGTSGISVLVNTAAPGSATASFAAQRVFGSGAASSFVATADIDGDGMQDVLALSGNNAEVSLNATTAGGVPTAVLSASSLTFGSSSDAQLFGTPVTKSVTVTNNGTGPLHITSVSGSGDFTAAGCVGTLAPTDPPCTITVTFTPAGVSSRTGTVTINDDAAGGQQTISLTGWGTALDFSQGSAAWLDRTIYTTSATRTITVTNKANAALKNFAVSLGGTNPGQFDQTNCNLTTLAVQGTCSVVLTFTPTSDGPKTAQLKISYTLGTTSPPTQTDIAPLSASGLDAGAGFSSTAGMTFSDVNVGNTSAGKTRTITDNGDGGTLGNITFTLQGTNPGQFSVTNTCDLANGSPGSLADGANCTFTVKFSPTTAGSKTATLHIAWWGTNDNVSPHGQGSRDITITGTGVTSGGGTGCPPPPQQCQ